MLIAISPAGQLFECRKQDGIWKVFKRQPDGTLKRHLSLDLPNRSLRTEAERDMKRWAERRGCEVVEKEAA